MRQQVVGLTGRRCPVFFESKAEQRARLEADVDAFLRSGGVIHQYAPGRARGLSGVSRARLEVIRGIWRQMG